jgi:hypothetical protein
MRLVDHIDFSVIPRCHHLAGVAGPRLGRHRRTLRSSTRDEVTGSHSRPRIRSRGVTPRLPWEPHLLDEVELRPRSDIREAMVVTRPR